MMKNLFFVIFIILAISACEDNNEICQNEINDNLENTASIIELTPKEYSVLSALSRNSTKIKEDEVREIVSDFKEDKHLGNKIMPIIKNKGLSKSTDSDVDTALYIVDFENNGGWAIIAGDARLPETILAYSDEGSLENYAEDEGFSVFMNYLTNYYDSCIVNFEMEKDSLVDIICEKSGLTPDSLTCLSKKQAPPAFNKDDIVDEWSTSTAWYNTFAVEPLVPVSWKQRDEYNEVLQQIKGKDYRLGCTSLATAQLMTYWKYPQNFYANGVYIDWSEITKYPNITDYNYVSNGDALKKQIQTLCYVLSGFCNTKYMRNNSMSLPKNSLEVLSNLGYRVPDGFIQYSKSRIENSMRKKTPIIAYGANKKTKGWSIVLSIATSGIVNKTIPQYVWLIDGFIRQQKTITNYVKYIDRYKYYNKPEILSLMKKAQNPINPSTTPNSSNNNSDKKKYSTVTKEYKTSYTREFIHMNWGWGDEISRCWYLADVFDCSDAYTINNGNLTSRELNHDEEYFKVHIATDIYPKN